MRLRDYRPEDERSWVRCRVLAFLDTAYFDDVHRHKERYTRPAVELVAEHRGEVIGLLDVECEERAGTVCSDRPGLGAMIWPLAVVPEFRRRGVGTALLREAERRVHARGIRRLEAWTRDDDWVRVWYERQGFARIQSYLHVYVDGVEAGDAIHSGLPGLLPVSVFAHYVGEDRDGIRARFRRVHECALYERRLPGEGTRADP